MDRFHEVRQHNDAWNQNMTDNCLSLWISCLDESMMIWFNKFTSPGFKIVPCKPHPFGNEWHTIACVLCGVLYRAELVEGKDWPCSGPPLEFI